MEVKPGYKQSEIGIIPEDWDVKALGEIGKSLIGLTYKPSDVRQNGTLVLRSSNIQNDALVFDDNVFVDTPIPERIKVQINDVLICVRNGSRDLIGKSVILDNRTKGMTFGAFMAVYRSQIGKLCSYLFQSAILKRQINEHLGATINQITNKSLNSFQIAIPPSKTEQRAIAEALGDADGWIESLENLLVKKRRLKQAAMQSLLTAQTRLPGFHGKWEVKRLRELGTTYGGLTGKTKADFGVGTGRYVTFMNVISNVVIDCESFEYVRVSPSEPQNRVNKGDLLFNGSSETPEEVAMCSLISRDIPNLFLNSFSFGFRLQDEKQVDGLFLAYYIRANPGRELMKSLAQGSTRYNLSKGAFLDATIRLPLKDEQTAVAEVLSGMDLEIETLEAKLAKARLTKQGMMQELLTGRIRLVPAA